MIENRSFLVLGAGELGASIIRSLAEQGYGSSGSLSVLLRPTNIASAEPEKRRKLAKLRELGVEFVPGDLLTDSIDRLAVSFERFHTVVSCTGFVAGRGTQSKITRAVLAAGVKRYVPWQFGVDYDAIGRGSAQDLWDEQLDVRDALRSQAATGWLIISTGLFTRFLFDPAFGVVDLKQNQIHALGSWDNQVTVTAPGDIGNLTASILLAEPALVNRVIYTAGDTITYGDLANTVDSILERKLDRGLWGLPRLKSELEDDPGNEIRKYRVAFAEGRGVAWDVNQTFNAEFRIPTMNVGQWLQKATLAGLLP